jgi:hypothetical protein
MADPCLPKDPKDPEAADSPEPATPPVLLFLKAPVSTPVSPSMSTFMLEPSLPKDAKDPNESVNEFVTGKKPYKFILKPAPHICTPLAVFLHGMLHSRSSNFTAVETN